MYGDEQLGPMIWDWLIEIQPKTGSLTVVNANPTAVEMNPCYSLDPELRSFDLLPEGKAFMLFESSEGSMKVGMAVAGPGECILIP